MFFVKSPAVRRVREGRLDGGLGDGGRRQAETARMAVLGV